MRFLAAVLLAGALLAACGSDDPKPTPVATLSNADALLTAVVPTMAPPSPTPPPQIMVRWEPAKIEELALYEGEELNDPGPPQDDRDRPREMIHWQAYAGQIGGAPRQLTDTKRRLNYPVWSRNGKRFEIDFFATSAGPPPTPYQPPDINALRGFDSYDATDLDQPPVEIRTQAGRSGYEYAPAPDGRHVAFFRQSALYVYDLVDGTLKKMAGPSGIYLTSWPGPWSPDSAYLIGITPLAYDPAGPRAQPHYLIPTVDGPARLVASPRGQLQATWSERAKQMAYMTDGDVWLMQVPGGQKRRLTTARRYGGDYVNLAWIKGTNRIQVANETIDTGSGAIVTYPLPPGVNAQWPAVSISSDGRYMVSALPSFPPPTVDACPPVQGRPQPSRVYLYDRTTALTTVLNDCDPRNGFTGFEWLADSRHLLMSGADCNACETPYMQAVLKDVVSGEETHLTNGFEFWGRAWPSPDGSKLLVQGDALRIYSNSGELLQRIDLPPGLSVIGAGWAPDSRHYAYVLGPTGLWGI